MGVTDSDYNSSASYLPVYLDRRPEGADLRAELLTCDTSSFLGFHWMASHALSVWIGPATCDII